MLIDWLTLRLSGEQLSSAQREYLASQFSRVVCINPNGEITSEAPKRQTLRSDTHSINVVFASDLEIAGSPCRVMENNNVFGSPDIKKCAEAMIKFVAKNLGIVLPKLQNWNCSRIDYTHNYYLETLSNVNEALRILSITNAQKQAVKPTKTTVYWGKNSNLRSGKAYAKGPHLQMQVNKAQASATEPEIKAAQGLLRLELTLRTYWLKRNGVTWYELTHETLRDIHEKYFMPLVGDLEVTDMNEVKILERLEEETGSIRIARNCISTWAFIKAYGYQHALEMRSSSTFYRHIKALKAAGLGMADLQSGEIVNLRKKTIVLAEPVKNWDELKQIAA